MHNTPQWGNYDIYKGNNSCVDEYTTGNVCFVESSLAFITLFLWFNSNYCGAFHVFYSLFQLILYSLVEYAEPLTTME
jgi:hypothetical protein